jgi:uncharacterized protein (DUF2252 family)
MHKLGTVKTKPQRATENSCKAGARLRQRAPRAAHAQWTPPADRADPVQVLIDQGRTRIQSLLPVRYARMRTDPFAFLRGAAAIMAADLAHTPACGLRVQACGDCHLANFGSYASPEGEPVFDVNDFDETLPAPFEWDVKRLATSLAVAGRVASMPDRASRKLARSAVRSYREHMASLASMSPLAAWNSRIDLAAAIADIGSAALRRRLQRRLAKALASGEAQFGLVQGRGRASRIREKLPLVYHIAPHELDARRAFASYAATLQEDRRVLLARYELRDVAFKVVGVGSVGTFCAIGLFVSAGGAPLLLQIKQAQDSVLAPFAGASAYRNQGERVGVGQRMMQAATDVLLGWTLAPLDGRDFYVRRMKDGRLASIGAMIEEALPFYAMLCGRTLARAHARAGDAAATAGYLGQGTAFDDAVADFAMAYADQTERDWHAFTDAIAAGRLIAMA